MEKIEKIGNMHLLLFRCRYFDKTFYRNVPLATGHVNKFATKLLSGRVAQSVGHLTRKSGILGSIPGLAIYFCFSFRFFMKGSCQLLAKVCARSTG